MIDFTNPNFVDIYTEYKLAWAYFEQAEPDQVDEAAFRLAAAREQVNRVIRQAKEDKNGNIAARIGA